VILNKLQVRWKAKVLRWPLAYLGKTKRHLMAKVETSTEKRK